MRKRQRFVLFLVLFAAVGWTSPSSGSEDEGEDQAHAAHVTESMGSPHLGLHSPAHMKWTAPRPQTPGGRQRAAEISTTLRATLEKYKDVHVAEQEGFTPFLPQFPQPVYHFTNYWQGLKAVFRFDPTQPTSLLYKKTPDGYELIGAMYTAPKRLTEEQLNARIPLSVARWHTHVNLCFPPRGADLQSVDWSRFGGHGSIATQEECVQAGGRFWPQLFGWMVHVYPFEETPEKIWAQ